MDKVIYAGDREADNWLDFKEQLIETLLACDNEYKFNKVIIGIWMSVNINPEHAQELRKSLNLKPLSEKELDKLKKMYEEEEKQK